MNDREQNTTDPAAGAAAFPRSADKPDLEEGAIFTPRFDADGLIAAIVSDAATGELLMFAYMNAEALARTIETRQAHFYSRSRGRLWRKGEDSGNILEVESLSTDCDQDAVWLRVTIAGHGAACHTGRVSCFYRDVALGGGDTSSVALRARGGAPLFDPRSVYRGKGE